MNPRVSIGVPVFNGASLLAETLEDLAAQSFTDFEVVISDNASTDATAEIASDFARRDPRFRLIRQAANIGPLPNYRAVAAVATAPRFLWRAYDDLSNRAYLAELMETMDHNPEALLVAPRSGSIRIGSPKKRSYSVAHLPFGASPARLLRASKAGWFYGMFQRDHALATIDAVISEYPHLWAWDHLMLFPAIVSSRIAFADKAVFFHRLNAYASKAFRPEGRQLAEDYRAFCERRITAAALPVFTATTLRLALWSHIGRRVVPLRRRLTG